MMFTHRRTREEDKELVVFIALSSLTDQCSTTGSALNLKLLVCAIAHILADSLRFNDSIMRAGQKLMQISSRH